MKESDLRLGDIFTTPTYGNAFDRFVGSSIRFVTATTDQYGKWQDSKVNHAGLYVGDGQIIEAAPGGARLRPWNTYGSDACWSVGGLAQRLSSGGLGLPIHLDDVIRSKIAACAKDLVGTPYGYADLLAIGLAQQRLKNVVDVHKALEDQPWWVRQITSRNSMICSQLVDFSYSAARVHLFEDGRLPGLVSPADLFGLYL